MKNTWRLTAVYPDGWRSFRQFYPSRAQASRFADCLVMSNQRAGTWGPNSNPRCWITAPDGTTYRVR